MMDTVKRIENSKIIARAFGVEKERIVPLAKALIDGGIDCIEIPFDPKGVTEDRDVADEILLVSRYFGEKACVGAGSVTDVQKAELAKLCGAKFIVSAHTDPAIIEKARELSLVSVAGAFTPSEIMTAANAGANIVNIFPASFFGTEYIEEIMKELPDLKLTVSGGINVWNMRAFLDCGCIGAEIGGNLVSEAYKSICDYEIITQTALAYKGITDNKRR